MQEMFNPWVRKIPWRRAWQPILVLLPGEFHGQRSLEGYSPWNRKESDTTEVTQHACTQSIKILFNILCCIEESLKEQVTKKSELWHVPVSLVCKELRTIQLPHNVSHVEIHHFFCCCSQITVRLRSSVLSSQPMPLMNKNSQASE